MDAARPIVDEEDAVTIDDVVADKMELEEDVTCIAEIEELGTTHVIVFKTEELVELSSNITPLVDVPDANTGMAFIANTPETHSNMIKKFRIVILEQSSRNGR